MATATATYRFTSNKNDFDGTERLVLEGSTAAPTRYVDIGGEIELTADEHEHLSRRHRLTEVDEQTRDARGVDLADTEVSEARGQAELEESASGAQSPAKDADKDKRPGGGRSKDK